LEGDEKGTGKNIITNAKPNGGLTHVSLRKGEGKRKK